MRVAILAPIKSSLYSRLVTHLAASEPGIEVVCIVVRTVWSIRRFRSDLHREGNRLLRKAYTRLVLSDEAADWGSSELLHSMARELNVPGTSLTDLAADYNIPLVEVKDHNDKVSENVLRDSKPDVIAFTGGGLIRENILNIPTRGILNCHMGILPEYRGMDVVEWPVIENRDGDPMLGLSLHFMDAGVDTGPILRQERIELQPGDTSESIRARMVPFMVTLMLDGIRGLRDGSITPEPQSLEAGKQYYVMHPRMVKYSEQRLSSR